MYDTRNHLFRTFHVGPVKYVNRNGTQSDARIAVVVVGERVPNADRRREAVMGDIKPTMTSEEESDDQNAQTLQRRRPL